MPTRPESPVISPKITRLLITDGPFAETPEQLAGYYLLDCKDLNEAIRWAARIPIITYGSIEIRPLDTGSQK